MRRIVFVLLTVLPLAGGIAYMGGASGQAASSSALSAFMCGCAALH